MRINLMSCVILATLLLAACGNDNSTDNIQSSDQTTTVVTEAMLAQDPELRIDESHHVLLTIESQQSEVDSSDLSGAGKDCYNFQVTKNMSVSLYITSPNEKFSNALYEAESPDPLAEASEGQESDIVTLMPNEIYTLCVKNEGDELQSLTNFFESESSSLEFNRPQTASISSSANRSQEKYSLTSTHKLSGSACAWPNADQSDRNYANYIFSQCNFNGTNFTNTSFANTTVQHTDMTNANFTGTDLTNFNINDIGDVVKDNNWAGAKNYHQGYYCRVDSPIGQCNDTTFTVQHFTDLITKKICSSNYPSCDFSRAYIYNQDLSQSNFKTINLSGASINNTKLVSADLSNASLNNAKIENSDMSAANMQNADLTGTTFSNTWLSGVIYNDSGATIYCEAGSKGSCQSASYSADDVLYLLAEKKCPPNNSTCEFPKLYIADKDLSGIDLSNANLKGTYFSNVNFTKANLNGVQGVVDWGNTSIFKGAIFTENEYCMASSLPGNCAKATSYDPSDVQELINNQSAKAGSDFTGVYLSGEQFWKGLFDNVVFNKSDFSNTTIKDTSMRSSQFEEATFSGALIALVDFAYSQFVDANFSDAIFDGQTSFKNAVFNNVNFQNTDFRSVLLDDATFTETDFTYSTVNIEELLNNSQISGKTTMPNGTVCEDLAECIKLCTSANNYCESHP